MVQNLENLDFTIEIQVSKILKEKYIFKLLKIPLARFCSASDALFGLH